MDKENVCGRISVSHKDDNYVWLAKSNEQAIRQT